MSLIGTALILAWVAIVLLALSVAGLMRQVHLLLLRDEVSARPVASPPPSSGVPEQLAAPDGARVVLFASPSCVTCFEAIDELAVRAPPPGVMSTVVTAGDRHPGWPAQLHYIEHAADLFSRFDVVATPHALAVVGDEVVEAAPVGSVRALRRLLDRVPGAVTEPAEESRR